MGFGIGFVTMKEMFSTTFKPLSNHFYRGYNHCRNHSLTNDNMNTYIIISLIKYIHEYSWSDNMTRNENFSWKLINHVPIYQSETSTGGTATGAAQIVFQLMLLAELMTESGFLTIWKFKIISQSFSSYLGWIPA